MLEFDNGALEKCAILGWQIFYKFQTKDSVAKKKKMLLETIETTRSQGVVKTKEVPEIRSESVGKGFKATQKIVLGFLGYSVCLSITA